VAHDLPSRIVDLIKHPNYRPQRPRKLAKALDVAGESHYGAFRDALRELMHEGRVALGAGGAIVLPAAKQASNRIIGHYRHNKRGFGFVVPTDPTGHEDLFIPEGNHGGAITGDIVAAVITSRSQRDGKQMFTGRVIEVIERTHQTFVGTLQKVHGEWMMFPDGNTLTQPVLTPDAATRHIRAGTKIVVELTQWPTDSTRPQGVITEVLGAAGEKDVDLKSVIVQFNLPSSFPDSCKREATNAVATFDPQEETASRLDLTREVICTIDPDDAKDYDDAISLTPTDDGLIELGVHIADVSYFVREGSALDEEASKRGNSTYFPGFVIPMLPEVLSNGVCSLQEGVPRLCKSAFITIGEDAKPVRTRFANTIIKSARRLRYTEAQDIIDGKNDIRHPDGSRRRSDYPRAVVDLLMQMDELARRIQKRRHAAGQLVLNLPEVELVLDQDGKVIDAVPEDTSFTHTLIEMFMVEANEAVARLLDRLNVPFLRRTHPEPEIQGSERLRQFVQVAGHRLPKVLDRHAIQALLKSVKGTPEEFAINLAVLKSLTRAEYAPKPIGHYALASDHYCHFTSPIRRYADLTIHRLLDAYFDAGGAREFSPAGKSRGAGKRVRIDPEDVPSVEDLVQTGKRISFTERRSEDAERELRQVKILTLMQGRIGDEFAGVVTGITNFGIFVQIREYLVDGLIRYEDLLDDWWDVDERGGLVRGQRTGTRIKIGDFVKVVVVKVDLPRRELGLHISQLAEQSRGVPLHGTQAAKKKGKRGTNFGTGKKHKTRRPKEQKKKGRRPRR